MKKTEFTTDKRAQLDALVARRDAAKEQVQRIKGLLEAAKKEQAAVEEECRKKNIDPAKLDTVIEQLESRYSQTVQELTAQITKAEKALTPFVEE